MIEPFAGSAGYSTYWEPEHVTLVDKDHVLVEIWRYLIAATAEDILELPDVEPGQDVREMGLCDGAAWLIGFWLNRGSASPKRTRTEFSTRTDRAQLVWSDRARDRIAGDVHKVSHWQIIHGDFEQTPPSEATYFIDPPYIDKGRYYRVRLGPEDYSRLALWVRQLPGRQIVCEQDGADWLPFKSLASIKSTKGRSLEVVWDSTDGWPQINPIQI